MTTYIHKDSRWQTGRFRPTSWHIMRTPLAHAKTFATYCGREFVTDDVMTETPDAATCETCFRYEAKARERADGYVHYWGITHSCGDPVVPRHYPTLHWEDDERVAFLCDECGGRRGFTYREAGQPEDDASTAPTDAPDVP